MKPSHVPIDVVSLLPVLDEELMTLLRSLSAAEWQKQTVAKLWKVKDVVAHLLDGNIRILSILRDTYQGEQADIKSNADLVDFLNKLNADWVKAMKRVSPEMLILLHQTTGKLYCDYYASLDPIGPAAFSVSWAGESESKNWMHIAREYTEKWLHQQQIRDAVNKPGLLTKKFFYPFITIFMRALPYTFRDVNAEEGAVVKVTVISSIGGSWFLERRGVDWLLCDRTDEPITAELTIDPDTAWKLFSKSIRPDEVKDKITITGNKNLGEVALTMVSVMA